MERLPYKECETCRDWNGNINKCHLCTEKCPQEELACEIAKGRMYATNEMIKLQKAYDKMARYLEEDTGCCPANYDNTLHREKCRTCLQECLYNQNKDYNKELSVECWKKEFIESEDKDGCIN